MSSDVVSQLRSESDHLESALFSARQTLRTSADHGDRAQVGVDAIKKDSEKFELQLKRLSAELEGVRQSNKTGEVKMKEAMRQLDDELSTVRHKEAALTSRSEQRKRIFQDTRAALLAQRVVLRNELASAESSQRLMMSRIHQLDENDSIRLRQEQERLNSRIIGLSQLREADAANFDDRHKEIHRLKYLGHDEQLQTLDSERAAAEGILREATAEMFVTVERGDGMEQQCKQMKGMLQGVPTMESQLRDFVAQSDALKTVIRSQETTISNMKAQIVDRECAIRVGQSDRDNEVAAEGRISELVSSLDALRGKLVVARERREVERARRSAEYDQRVELRRHLDDTNQRFFVEKERLESEISRRTADLEALAAQTNDVHARYAATTTSLDAATARLHATTAELESAKRKDQELRTMTERSARALEMATQYN